MEENILKYEDVENRIITLLNQKVMVDADVAELYGVETKEINQAVRNNPDKFPVGYIIDATKDEKSELVKIFDRFDRMKHSTVLPKAFTEKGLYMLATILRSPKATATTIAIVETFAKIRELSRTVMELSNSSDEKQQKTLMQKGGELISEVLGDELNTTETESEIELNFAVLKFKHTVKRTKDK
ncbi:MAG: ORF6N domain-containing protein [Paludibacteraceae bacterium]|nr:ORF6N domain-containing protein [Paludibacteraceae bacterium]